MRAADETEPFEHGRGDIADDPAIWVDPNHPARSVVIGSSKSSEAGGLAVYDLDGRELQFVPLGRINNVDVRSVGEDTVLVVATNRTRKELSYFFLDQEDRALIPAGSVATGFEPYGVCLYASPASGRVFVFVTERTDSSGRFDQYALSFSGSSVSSKKVREMSTTSQSEGCVANDEGQEVFLSQERAGLFRYAAEPDESGAATPVDLAFGGQLVPDVEGVAIAHAAGDRRSYLVVSSQGDSSYHVYELDPPYTHRKRFTIGGGVSADGTSQTDGLDVTLANLGSRYPHGLLVVHDGKNAGEEVSNFKFVDAGDIFAGIEG